MGHAEISLERLRILGRLIGAANVGARRVDDATWADLDMDAVCAHIDRTRSVPGLLALHGMLRSPLPIGDALTERNTLIERFAPDREGGLELGEALARMARTAGGADLASLLWEEAPTPLSYPWLHRLLALVAILSVPLAFFGGGPAVFAPIVAFAVNAAVHFRARVRWQWEIQALRFAGALRDGARRALPVCGRHAQARERRLRQAVDATSSLARRVALLSAGGIKDILYEYVNVFLLLELMAYQNVVRDWERAAPAMQELFLIVGELDALRSVAAWRAEQTLWCLPEHLEHGPARIEMEDGVHPLIDRPVPNSLSLAERGCIVTGANMSGKSTLLRTLGINAILATTIVTCTARRYRATTLRVASSMRVGDDVTTGKSRYLAEAERLLDIVRLADTDTPTLCLIDELLSGTNAAERLAASSAILDYLERRGLLVVAATHDLELTERLAGRFDSYFFADDFAQDDLAFDHRLQRGVAHTRNALALLERLGYPSEILAAARTNDADPPAA